MAIIITVPELVNALRLGSTDEETAEATRLLAVATAAVERHLGSAFDDLPDAVAGEAAIRLCGYWFDQPLAGRGAAFADAARNSGALQILAGWKVHRAGTTGDAAAETAPAPAPAGAVLRQTGVEAVTVSTADEWVSTALPFPLTSVFGVKVGEASIELGLTADLPTVGLVAGGDASAAIGSRLYALGAVAAGGVLFFAASEAGTSTVRLFDHG